MNTRKGWLLTEGKLGEKFWKAINKVFKENNILEITQTLNQKIIKCSARLILNQDYIKEVPIEIKMGYGFIQSVEGPKVFILSKEEALS